LLGDVGGAIDYLRGLATANGKVATIGHCSGGRQSVLAACRLPIDAAVDCYGAFVLKEPPAKLGFRWAPIPDALPDLNCPLLGLFGEEDAMPSPAEVAEFDGLLTKHSKVHEFHSYPNAGHGFFAVDRPSYRQAAAVDGWVRIRDFFGRHLAA
jgi:carboxymethylenebutenolidase